MLLDDNDRELIRIAVAQGGDTWNDESLAEVKRKIKMYYLGNHEGHCCYCRERFAGGFLMTIDIEHVLPKSRYKDYMFELFNLNISCKRCNMLIKKERVDFLVDPAQVHLNPKDSEQYYFIHPNLDRYFEHLGYEVLIIDGSEMVKYIPKKPKGEYAYTFFKLEQKEIDSFNKAQGIKIVETDQLLPDESPIVQDAMIALVEKL